MKTMWFYTASTQCRNRLEPLLLSLNCLEKRNGDIAISQSIQLGHGTVSLKKASAIPERVSLHTNIHTHPMMGNVTTTKKNV